MMDSNVIELNDGNFEASQRRAQVYLDKTARESGKGACLKEIKRLAVDTGFIQDDRTEVVRYTIQTDTPWLTFIFQYNPARGTRFNGAGRKHPPPGRTLEHDGCPLSPKNMPIQQRGTEFPYGCELGGTAYNIMAQPFPFEDDHVIAATDKFRPQDVQGSQVGQVLRELCDFADWCPEFVVMLNGSDGAGATINWSHLHGFTRPDGEPFPLEALAASQILDTELHLVDGYPLPIVVTRGPVEEAIEEMSVLISTWMDSYGPSATMNLIATTRSCDDGEIIIYFCPRDRRNARVPGFSGAVGGLEILGEMLGWSEEDKRRIDRGKIDARFVQHVLASVRAEGFERFFARHRRAG